MAKIVLKMKLTTICLLAVLAVSAANRSYSQVTNFNLNLSNASVKQVFDQIEQQSEFILLYDESQVDVNRAVNVHTKAETVESILDQVFAGTQNSYKIYDRQIVIFKKEEALPSIPTKAANRTVEFQSKDKAIAGQVKDPSGQSLPGVTVVIKGTTKGTVTDVNGKYSISGASKEDVLMFSFVGMKTQELAIGNQQTINVTLESGAIGIDEVVAIGYGSMKKSDLTGAVANIKAEDMNAESAPNVLTAMQGKLAGVDIVSQGGAPGSSAKVMIRGVGTFNNSSPLYIVDGMYMDGIDFLNPNDIESIDVLKDASSAAIYGSRAANGVIIVTTKSGKQTDGIPTITASANVGVQDIPRRIDVLNASDWARISTLSREAAGLSPLELAANPQADVDWQDEVMQLGIMQNYNLSAQGANDNFKYFLGTGYANQEGTIKETKYQRANVQLKTELKKGRVTIGENILVSYSTNNPVSRASNRTGGLVGAMLNSVPAYSVYDEDAIGGFGGPTGDVINWGNPLGMLEMQEVRNENYKTYVNTYLIVDLPFDLSYKLNVNTDLWGSYGYNYRPPSEMEIVQNPYSILTESRGQTKRAMVENLLTYDRSFKDHKLTVLIGNSFQTRHYRGLSAIGQSMPDGIYVIGAAQEASGSSSENTNALSSLLGRVFYSYKGKYLFNATIRRDGSSKFAEENRYGVFPSLSLGWNMKEEGFMQDLESLNQLKIRAGYGVLGNQEVDNYLYESNVTTNINYPMNGSELLPGAFPKEFASPSIKWESTKMVNIGVDLALFKNRLASTIEYYEKTTSDILLNVPIPISTGASNNPLVNSGEIRNKGLEMMIGWNDRVGNDWDYRFNFVASKLKNEVVKMGTGDQVITGGRPNHSGGYTTRSLQGYPIGGFWLVETDEIFQSSEEVLAHSKDGNLIQPNAQPGDIRFKDHNEDGVINDDDRIYKGSPFPSWTLGLNSSVRWKNLDMSMGLQASIGAKIYNSIRADIEDVSKGINYSSSVLDSWSEANTDASMPRLIWGDPNQNMRTSSDRFLENGSYFRITNLQLGYNMKELLPSFLNTFRVYVNADNLLTVTDYTGFSPDVNNSNILGRGVDIYSYPLARRWTLGINVTF